MCWVNQMLDELDELCVFVFVFVLLVLFTG